MNIQYPKQWQKGEGIEGPNYANSINNDERPIIIRSTHSGKFFVGPYKWVFDGLRRQAAHETSGAFHLGDQSIYIFESRKSAILKFEFLCEEVESFNREQESVLRNLQTKLTDQDNQATIILDEVP